MEKKSKHSIKREKKNKKQNQWDEKKWLYPNNVENWSKRCRALYH